jgi:hypothetical protein
VPAAALAKILLYRYANSSGPSVAFCIGVWLSASFSVIFLEGIWSSIERYMMMVIAVF